MLKGLFSVLIAIGIYTEGLAADAPLPSSSSEEPVNEHKSLPCPQCGDWAISEASETGVRGVRVKNIDAAIGEYLHVDKNTIVIPACGSFNYKVQASEIETSDSSSENQDVYVISMSLQKLKGEKLCNGDDWTLQVRVFSGAVDDGGQGSFILESARKSINPRYFGGWNIARTDPSENDGTPGMGQFVVFKVAQTKKALSQSVSRLRPVYERMKVEPFDVERFGRKVTTYCEKYFSDAIYNPSIGNKMLDCEYMVLSAKQDKFASVNCDKAPTSNQKCKLPSESLK